MDRQQADKIIMLLESILMVIDEEKEELEEKGLRSSTCLCVEPGAN